MGVRTIAILLVLVGGLLTTPPTSAQPGEAGLSLEEAKATVMLEEYADWAQYDRLREKGVEAAYRNLTVYR